MKLYIIVAIFFSQAAFAINLHEAFKKALENDDVKATEAQVLQTLEQVNQVEGGLYPEINLTGAITRQEDDEVFRRGFGQQTQKSLQLQLEQPLFQGFKEFAALRLAKAQNAIGQTQLELAKLNLYQALADIFYNILSIETEIELTKELAKISQDRIGYLEKRVKVGRSRKSELISARAQYVSVKASLDELKSTLIRQRQAFSLVTGLSENTKLDPQKIPIVSNDLDSLVKNIDQTPWIKIRDLELESSEEAISIAKANHWPSLSLRANYYLERGGSLQGVNWDVGLVMTMPIYSGGSDQAAVREAVAKKTETTLRRSYEKRKVESDLRATYAALEQGQVQLKGFQEAVTLNRRNYDELNREYGLGLVTNLDVINALNQYVQSQRDLNRIRVGNLKDLARLKTLTGEAL